MNILVVIDMQNDFVDGTLGTPEALKIIPAVVEKIKTYGGIVFATRDTHDSNYMNTLEGKKLPVPHCIWENGGWYLHTDICDALAFRQCHGLDREKIIDKPSFGSFVLCEEIAQYVLTHDVDEITVVGLCTDICVISNALMLRAKFPNIKIIVDAECCAGTTPENHQKALDIMQICQIDVINN